MGGEGRGKGLKLAQRLKERSRGLPWSRDWCTRWQKKSDGKNVEGEISRRLLRQQGQCREPSYPCVSTKFHLEVLPWLQPPTLLALQLCKNTALSAQHQCPSGQFDTALLLLHRSLRFLSPRTKSNPLHRITLLFSCLALSLSLFLALC